MPATSIFITAKIKKMNAPSHAADGRPKNPQLCRAWLGGAVLPSNVTVGSLQKYPERCFQFGEGNFLRAFVDWMIDVLNERGLFGGSVVVAQPIPGGHAAAVSAQDGLYTVLTRGIQNGQPLDRRRIVTAVSRALNPYEEWERTVECFRNPTLRFVFSNTTEAGIAMAEEPHEPTRCPKSFPAKVAALLYERYKFFGGHADRGLVFLPCELIERNGDKLREITLRHAERWGLGADFARWASECNYFLNTLVDRIVPGYPRDEIERLTDELGYADSLIAAAELFHLWVIEGPKRLADELPFDRAGLNVVWTDDLTPYRTRKVYILNGAHTTCSLAAFLGGIDAVREMVEDPLFGRFVRQAIFDEIVPFVPLDEREKLDYANAVLERFRNPFIRHELLSISLNSVSKWKVRTLPSVLAFVRRHGTAPKLLSFSLAALIRFYRGLPNSAVEMIGSRNGQDYPIRDDAAVIDRLAQCWNDFERHKNFDALAAAVLGQTDLWDVDLNGVAGLTDSVARYLQSIDQTDIRSALEKILR